MWAAVSQSELVQQLEQVTLAVTAVRVVIAAAAQQVRQRQLDEHVERIVHQAAPLLHFLQHVPQHQVLHAHQLGVRVTTHAPTTRLGRRDATVRVYVAIEAYIVEWTVAFTFLEVFTVYLPVTVKNRMA